MIKSYIINLDRDVERMQHMQSLFRDLGLPFERISATDGRKMPEQELNAFIAARSHKPDAWLKGQVGCFLSHFQVWQKIAAGTAPYAAIFEDDLHLAPTIKDALHSEHWLPQGFDLVRFETSTNRLLLDKKPVGALAMHGLYRLRSTSWCAGAYVMSKDCAQKLIALPPSAHDCVDYFLFSHEDSNVARGLIVYQFAPALATQDKYITATDKAIGFNTNIDGYMPRNFTTRCIAIAKKITPRTFYKMIKGYRRVPFQS